MQPSHLPEGIRYVTSAGGIDAFLLEENGLEILLYRQQAIDVAAFMVTYHVGSRNEGTGLTGATHFLEHLMFKGTERYNHRRGTSIFHMLQSVGAEVNASTWLDRTNYYSVLPSDYLDLAMDIEADRMRHALLAAEDVESERTVILNELDRGENEPLRKLYQMVWSMAYVAHPYRHPTIGWRREVEKLTPEDLKKFYDTFYWPDNATISVIGGFEVSEALQRIVRHFGPIPRAPHPLNHSVTEEPRQQGRRSVEVKRAGELGAVMIACKMPHGRDGRSDALDLLARILALGRGSRLHKSLTDRGYATSVGASSFRLRDPGLFIAYALLAPDVEHAFVEEQIRNEWASVVQEGVTEEERNRALAMIRAQEAYERDGPYNIAAQLNEAIATGDWRLYSEYVERLERIGCEDIRKAAAEFLREEQSTSGWYVPV